MHFRMDALVVRIVHQDRGESDFIKDGKHGGRRVCEKIGKDGFGQRKVEV